MSNDDRQLVTAFTRSRDEAAFRKLYRQHTPVLYALARRLAGNRSGAEELTQQAWVRAVENHDRFRGRSQYRTWIIGILINCFRESVRRHAREIQSYDDQREQPAAVAPFPGGPRTADILDVENALAQLPAGYREVVILHDVNGYTHLEISALLGISAGTSKSQLNRGRARLRTLLTATTPAKNQKRGTA